MDTTNSLISIRGYWVIGQMAESRALVDQGVDVIVSGCTEFPLVLGAGDLDVPLLSSTDELAKRTIALARGDMPLPQ